ncbi:MAG: anthranilate phosphoribosyltransferase, partial [Thiogranum sp.]
DEISIGGPTQVAELNSGEVNCYRVAPQDFGMETGSVESLAVSDAKESLALINRVFDNEAGPARDIVQLNAGAAIYVSGVADSLAAGVSLAGEAIASGAAREKFARLIAISNGF